MYYVLAGQDIFSGFTHSVSNTIQHNSSDLSSKTYNSMNTSMWPSTATAHYRYHTKDFMAELLYWIIQVYIIKALSVNCLIICAFKLLTCSFICQMCKDVYSGNTPSTRQRQNYTCSGTWLLVYSLQCLSCISYMFDLFEERLLHQIQINNHLLLQVLQSPLKTMWASQILRIASHGFFWPVCATFRRDLLSVCLFCYFVVSMCVWPALSPHSQQGSCVWGMSFQFSIFHFLCFIVRLLVKPCEIVAMSKGHMNKLS